MTKINQSGFSITEILIAAALMSVVSFGFATLLLDLQKNKNNVEFVTDADGFNEELRKFLSDSATCTKNFAGLFVDTNANFNITNLKTSVDTVQYQTGSTYDSSLVLSSLVLDSYKPGTSTTKGQMLLKTALSKKKISNGAADVQRAININLEINPVSGRIIGCTASSHIVTELVWNKSYNATGDIFFPDSLGGNVGIGEADPADKLVVSGVISATSGVRLSDGKILSETPPSCTGNKYLQWDGRTWLCHTPQWNLGGGSGSGRATGFGSSNGYNNNSQDWRGGNQGNNGGAGGNQGSHP